MNTSLKIKFSTSFIWWSYYHVILIVITQINDACVVGESHQINWLVTSANPKAWNNMHFKFITCREPLYYLRGFEHFSLYQMSEYANTRRKNGLSNISYLTDSQDGTSDSLRECRSHTFYPISIIFIKMQLSSFVVVPKTCSCYVIYCKTIILEDNFPFLAGWYFLYLLGTIVRVSVHVLSFTKEYSLFSSNSVFDTAICGEC